MTHAQHQGTLQIIHECIRLDRKCAEMCGYLEQAITRNSPFIAKLAVVSATICQVCGLECQKHDHDHY